MLHILCNDAVMSSHDSISTVYKCMLRGAADFLVKPIRRNELKNLWQHVWRRQSVCFILELLRNIICFLLVFQWLIKNLDLLNCTFSQQWAEMAPKTRVLHNRRSKPLLKIIPQVITQAIMLLVLRKIRRHSIKWVMLRLVFSFSGYWFDGANAFLDQFLNVITYKW